MAIDNDFLYDIFKVWNIKPKGESFAKLGFMKI